MICIICGFIAMAYLVCYKWTSMRFRFFESLRIRLLRAGLVIVLLLLFLTACGGRSLNKNVAQDLVAQLSSDTLHKEDVYIESVTQTGERSAIVEAKLQTAFRFEKIHGRWVIKEVRVGRAQWQSLDEFQRALDSIKTEDTKKLLEKVAEAIEMYRKKNGGLPAFTDFVSLTNVLNPDYLTPLVRLDAWQHPLTAERIGSDGVRLMSAGRDGKLGTSDDIVLSRRY
ncbi:MAG TPA: type II secretion system protein GspG [Acidobacteriota bacterium]|nr:type II secretion system protein GspG [Acidobacteriota bacterium]